LLVGPCSPCFHQGYGEFGALKCFFLNSSEIFFYVCVCGRVFPNILESTIKKNLWKSLTYLSSHPVFFTLSLGLVSPPIPSFQWSPQNKEILLNLRMKWWNSAFNAQVWRVITVWNLCYTGWN
jgi:hypothetical protein